MIGRVAVVGLGRSGSFGAGGPFGRGGAETGWSNRHYDYDVTAEEEPGDGDGRARRAAALGDVGRRDRRALSPRPMPSPR